MRVVTLVPYRPDAERDRLWAWCRARWEHHHPDWPIFLGASPDGPFNRSAAVNDAARNAGEWDVAVLIDADVAADPERVREAVQLAHNTGRVVLPYDERIHLNRTGTHKVLAGFDGSWRTRQFTEAIYRDQDSCVVCIPRSVWDEVGGFDENFVGWFGEDTAFNLAAETLTGLPVVRLEGELFHLHHRRAPDAAKDAPTRIANERRLARYRCADRDAIRALLDDDLPPTRIPRILFRTVPEQTTDEVEGWWAEFVRLHPGWDCRTYRDPLDPAEWPLTADLWSRCQNGAQLAGLVRLEGLVTHGGCYVDSDVKPYRSLEPLLHLPAFAGWEDETTLPDAVLGAAPHHPAFVACLEKARASIEGGGDAYQSGPMVTTEVLPNRDDVLTLPPGAFYPHHYLQKNQAGKQIGPWVFAEHCWHHSWGSDAAKRSIERRQR